MHTQTARKPTRLAAQIVGQGKDLLLFHGGRGSRNHWVRNVEALARHFRVFALDLPGYGESPGVADKSDPDAYIEALQKAIEDLELAPAPFNLAAFSFGATLAASLAARLGKRVGKLSLIGPSGFGPGPGYPRELRSLKGASPEAVDGIIADNLGLTMLSSREAVTDEAVVLHKANLACTRFNSHKMSIRASTVGDLARVQCPAQIIWGERDRLAHPSVAARAEACCKAVPTLRVDLISGAGHWAQFENAPETNRVLLEFLLA